MAPPEVVSTKPCPLVPAFKERPILFSAPMVRALLDGSKTQTRRVVKPQPPEGTTSVAVYHHPNDRDGRPRFWSLGPDPDAHGATDHLQPDWALPCPYGSVGERLYVRETWQHSNCPLGPFDEDCSVFYRADYMDDPHGPDGEKSPEGRYRSWKPAIHMPRAASRINLEITAVRIERLRDIGEGDAKAEGALIESEVGGVLGASYVKGYRSIWEEINGVGSWVANPWVWVVEFRRIK
jgi:hypothetical protein